MEKEVNKIVICSDGTGQSGGMLNPSNVWRLYLALNKETQSCFHDDGVGTGGNRFFRAIGGAFGFGISRNLRQIYQFIISQYEPEKTNELYFFGFSRGAFTVRVLSNLVCLFGIPDKRGMSPADIEEFSSLVLRNYKTANAQLNRHKKSDLADKIAEKYGVKDESKAVHLLGVWDTVEAVGLPIDEFTTLFKQFFPLKFNNNVPSSRIKNIFHAISIDEERRTFIPKLFHESQFKAEQENYKVPADVSRSEGDKLEESATSKRTIKQVWFPGCHAHVGGGYAKDQLALNSLIWMVKLATDKGLEVDQTVIDEFSVKASFHGQLLDSRSGLRMAYRYGPRNIEKLCKDNETDLVLHKTTWQRMQNQVDGYSPSALAFESTDKSYVPFRLEGSQDSAVDEAELGPLQRGLNEARKLTRARSLVFYGMFFTVVLTLALGVFCGWKVSDEKCWFTIPLDENLVEFENNMLDFAKSMTPGFASFIVDGLQKADGVPLCSLVLLTILFLADKQSILMIRDEAAKGWHGLRKRGGSSQEFAPKTDVELGSWYLWIYHHPLFSLIATILGFILFIHVGALITGNKAGADFARDATWFIFVAGGVIAVLGLIYCFVLFPLLSFLLRLCSEIMAFAMSFELIKDIVHSWKERVGPAIGFVLFVILLVVGSHLIWRQYAKAGVEQAMGVGLQIVEGAKDVTRTVVDQKISN